MLGLRTRQKLQPQKLLQGAQQRGPVGKILGEWSFITGRGGSWGEVFFSMKKRGGWSFFSYTKRGGCSFSCSKGTFLIPCNLDKIFYPHPISYFLNDLTSCILQIHESNHIYVGMTEGGLYFSRGARGGVELFRGQQEGGLKFFPEHGPKFPNRPSW